MKPAVSYVTDESVVPELEELEADEVELEAALELLLATAELVGTADEEEVCS